MVKRTRVIRCFGFLMLVLSFGILPAVAQNASAAASGQFQVPVKIENYHQAVGSWFGIATQVCAANLAPVACFNGQPPTVLFMTPTLFPDGSFNGNDSLTLAGPPFGPHTVAYGRWIPTSATEIVADYVFMMNTFPPTASPTISGARFRWSAQVISQDTMVGYVNVYFDWGIPIVWTRLAADAFPAIPNEALPLITSPAGFFKEPGECTSAATCPLIFKFTIKRVSP